VIQLQQTKTTPADRSYRRKSKLTEAERDAAEQTREEKIAALNEQLVEAIERLATSDGWRAMLAVSARFTSYSLNNQLLLWVQSMRRETTLTRVAAFGAWKKLGYRVLAGSKAYYVYAPVKNRLRPDEVAAWLTAGKNPYDCDGFPKIVVRTFVPSAVFDRAQVEPTDSAQELPDAREWVNQPGNGPAGLWDRLVAMTEAHGFTLERRPSVAADSGARGWTDYQRRIVWVNNSAPPAEQCRVLAHETLGHIRCEHETRRDVGRERRETEADSVAYLVLAALGFDIGTSSVEYLAGWLPADPDMRAQLLRESAQMVRRVALEALAELEQNATPADPEPVGFPAPGSLPTIASGAAQ
jgi:hypothetical protein